MRTTVLLFLVTGVFLTAISAWGDDTLPRLPGQGPESLPSLNSVSVATVTASMVSVSCYLGNPNDRNYLGTVQANSPQEAGPTCNSLNYSCRGRCFGCYSDFDLSEDVCVDSAGRKYLR